MKEENATVSLTHAGGNKCVLVIFNLRPVATSRVAFLKSVAKLHRLTSRRLRQNQRQMGWVSVNKYECAAALQTALATHCKEAGWAICEGSQGGRGLWSVKVGTESGVYEVFELENLSDSNHCGCDSQHRIWMVYQFALMR